MLVFAFSRDALEKAVANRVGQCVMTCPTTACYNGLPLGEKTISVGGKLRYFGDGWQISKWIGGRRYWRIPVMDGEFLCEETFGTVKGVAGGNIILMGTEPAATLAAAESAVAAMRRCPDVILPFPGGIARSGSKVGSKYKSLRASTNTAFAPTLRGVVATEMPAEARCAYEIVIDGLTLEAVERATAAGLHAREPHATNPRRRSPRATTAASSARSTSGSMTYGSDLAQRNEWCSARWGRMVQQRDLGGEATDRRCCELVWNVSTLATSRCVYPPPAAVRSNYKSPDALTAAHRARLRKVT